MYLTHPTLIYFSVKRKIRSKEKEFPQAGFQINVQSFACFWIEMRTNKEQFENQRKKKKTSNILFVPHMELNFWINKNLCGNCHIHVGDGLWKQTAGNQLIKHQDSFGITVAQVTILYHFHFWQSIILCLLKVCFQSLVRLFQLVAFYDHLHQILYRLHAVCFF